MQAQIQIFTSGKRTGSRECYAPEQPGNNLEALDIRAAFGLLEKCGLKDIVILGKPGSGKTTLLKYITITLIEGRGEEILGLSSQTVPFLVPVRELKQPDQEDFCAFVSRSCCLAELGITREALEQLLETGSGLILLDGLDEVADTVMRYRVVQWIEKARAIYQHTHFIITSRLTGYTGKYMLDGNLVELKINDFTPAEITLFLKNWYTTVAELLHPGNEWELKKGEEEAAGLFRDIARSPRLLEFVNNPLILQITALVHHDRGRLPERRVELYEECTDILLEKWDMAKGLDVLIQAREARQLLQPVALWLHQEDKRSFATLESITEVIRKPLAELGKSNVDPAALVQNIRDRSGIFMGYSENEYGFVHLSFQEYLAAEQIRNLDAVDLLVTNYANRWWREVLLLALSLENPSLMDKFLGAIVHTRDFAAEISLVQDAIADVRKKPVAVLESVLGDERLSTVARANVLTLLGNLAAAGHEAAVAVLKQTAGGKEQKQVEFAVNILKGLKVEVAGAADIIREIIHPKDGSEMVLIPAGSFLYGSKDDDKEAEQDEKPQRVIELPAFYMDKYPVTNEQYCRFLNEQKPGKKVETWIYLEGSYKKDKCRIIRKGSQYAVEAGYEKHPVSYIYLKGAEAYAKWAGKRLPTEEEWEKAARGTDGRKYPWGNEWEKGLCNSAESGIGTTTLVVQYPDGKSVFGCYDMAGNVWEWTSSKYSVGENWNTVRGGSWANPGKRCRCAARGFDLRGIIVSYDGVGFRCAVSNS